MDEIGQDPKLNPGIPRGRWLDAAVAVALIAAVVVAVITGRGGRPAASPAGGAGTAAVRRCCHRPGGHRSRCRSASPGA